MREIERMGKSKSSSVSSALGVKKIWRKKSESRCTVSDIKNVCKPIKNFFSVELSLSV